MAAPLDQHSLIDDLMIATASRLETDLKIIPEDSAKAGIVRLGKLQDDPLVKKINVLIHPGTEDHPDRLSTDFSPTAGQFTPSSFTIGTGGSSYWKRYLVAQLEIFFPNQSSRIDARMRANLVAARARNSIMSWKHPGRTIPPDSFGEAVQSVLVKEVWLREGGGPGDFNWRGEMLIEFLTELEPIGD